MDANEARKMTDFANRPDMERIEEKIRDAAKNGRNSVEICVDGASQKCLQNTKIFLQSNGFTIKSSREEDYRSGGTSSTLLIRW